MKIVAVYGGAGIITQSRQLQRGEGLDLLLCGFPHEKNNLFWKTAQLLIQVATATVKHL
ncbi:MAG: hypothetical protein J7L25_09195 [Deltaproteobacteria bacterium]|nr:hypothetical protein [Candidatus Tharpella aukensis]